MVFGLQLLLWSELKIKERNFEGRGFPCPFFVS